MKFPANYVVPKETDYTVVLELRIELPGDQGGYILFRGKSSSTSPDDKVLKLASEISELWP